MMLDEQMTLECLKENISMQTVLHRIANELELKPIQQEYKFYFTEFQGKITCEIGYNKKCIRVKTDFGSVTTGDNVYNHLELSHVISDINSQIKFQLQMKEFDIALLNKEIV